MVKYFLLILLNLILPVIMAIEAIPTTTDLNRSGFWLSTDVLSVEFLKGCISTVLCFEPKFKLINTMKINSDQSVISWPINGGDFLQVNL